MPETFGTEVVVNLEVAWCGAGSERRRSADSGGRATSFDHDHVSPFSGAGPVGHAAEPAAGANDLEAGGLVQSETGRVLGEDAGLDGPDSCGLGGVDDSVEKEASDAMALGGGST